MMAKRCELSGYEGTVFLCDTFTGVVKASDKDSRYKGGEHADTSLELVEELVVNTMRLSNVEILQGVYDSARDIAEWVWGRLVPGGMIVYDDYGFEVCDGVALHVQEMAAREDCIFVHNLNGHAVLIKRG